jgi:hypothetical protein
LNSTRGPAGDPEDARVINLVLLLIVGVDHNRYDIVEATIAPEIVIDYTNSWGGDPLTLTSTEYTDLLRSSVPGFDVTRHELCHIDAKIEGDDALASADFDVRHWLDGDLWRILGTYHWTLKRNAGQWAITSLRRIVTEVIGDQDIVAKAKQRAVGR